MNTQTQTSSNAPLPFDLTTVELAPDISADDTQQVDFFQIASATANSDEAVSEDNAEADLVQEANDPALRGTSLTDLTNRLLAGEISSKEWEEKASAVAAVIRREKAMVEAIRDEKRNLDDRMRTHQGNADRLQDYLQANMDAVGKRKFETASVRVSTRTTKVLAVDDEEKLRAEYPEYFEEKVSFKLDKTSLKKAMLDDGICSDYARVVANRGLIIK